MVQMLEALCATRCQVPERLAPVTWNLTGTRSLDKETARNFWARSSQVPCWVRHQNSESDVQRPGSPGILSLPSLVLFSPLKVESKGKASLTPFFGWEGSPGKIGFPHPFFGWGASNIGYRKGTATSNLPGLLWLGLRFLGLKASRPGEEERLHGGLQDLPAQAPLGTARLTLAGESTPHLGVCTLETPGEHQRWQMDVDPPQDGAIGYAPWPF